MSQVSSRRNSTGRRALAPLVCALALVLNSCGLDEVDIPPLGGPSSLGLDIYPEITPDVLTADAVSTAAVRATLRGPNGQVVAGRAVFFQILSEDGVPAAIGSLGPTSDIVPNNRGPEVTEVTGQDGVAQVIYRVPERIAFNDVAHVLIAARLVGNDAGGQQYKYVRLEIRPAEARVFPTNPDNAAPECTFNTDPAVGPDGGNYPTNFTIRFQTTASDSDGQVIRYFWDMGDGTQEDGKTLVNHAYRNPGNYTVTHVCTDNNGAQGQQTLNISVN